MNVWILPLYSPLKTNSLPLRIGHPKRKGPRLPAESIFRCQLAVPFREGMVWGWHVFGIWQGISLSFKTSLLQVRIIAPREGAELMKMDQRVNYEALVISELVEGHVGKSFKWIQRTAKRNWKLLAPSRGMLIRPYKGMLNWHPFKDFLGTLWKFQVHMQPMQPPNPPFCTLWVATFEIQFVIFHIITIMC